LQGSIVNEPSAAMPCGRCGSAHALGEPCPASGRTLAFGADGPAPLVRANGAPEPSDPLIGSQVGSFRILRLLGCGGMGTVYLAEHPVIGSRVAVKFLHDTMAADPAVVARFFDEARAVNLVGHENIVGIFDLSLLAPNRYYFVMEYLEGDTLQALLRRGPLDPGVGHEVLLQVCEALQCAHEHGVVHRDMKPENVFLVRRRGKDHFVKIVDFGIAKLRGAGRTGRTQAGFIVGTPEYMAPEQCEDGPIDARTDVYAVGAMAFEIATGRLPFEGRSLPQLLLAQLREKPPRPSELAPVSPALERTILRALEKDPAARFQDMASMAAALREAADAPRPVPSAASAPAAPTPAKPPAPASAVDSLSAEVSVRGAAPTPAQVAELTRGGVFLRAGGPLPPVRARVRLSIAHRSLRARLQLDGEVVRHVAPAQAAEWRMTPGYAVQFLDPTPEARAALSALADETRRDTPAPAPPPTAAATDERLRTLEARGGETHYAFLALPPDAEFAEIRRALRTLRDELEALRAHPLAPHHPSRATALLARAEAAQAALGTPAARLGYDARRGNHAGVARCLAAGVPAPLVEARRRELLEAFPDRAADAQRQLARAEVARKLGNLEAARAACELALGADPLDPRAHEAHAALKGLR
jgi:serine/threonine-protein kinase